MPLQKIGLGGGCHWCTEAYFLSLKGVEKVEQGWIASTPPNDAFSEAVLVHYDPSQIPLPVLIAIHLHTHAATKAHAFRSKYRSAVYVLEEKIPEIQPLTGFLSLTGKTLAVGGALATGLPAGTITSYKKASHSPAL